VPSIFVSEAAAGSLLQEVVRLHLHCQEFVVVFFLNVGAELYGLSVVTHLYEMFLSYFIKGIGQNVPA
jgi:hypothetical protein